MKSHPTSTARLTFRTWRDDDLPLARALFADPRVTALVGGPFDDAAIHARIATEIANQRTHGFQYWPISLRDGTDVGCCGLKPRDPDRKRHELGYYLLPAHWSRGFATEAGHSVIAFAFDALAARGLFAGHHPDNHGSREVLLKLGFRYTHHEHYPPTGLDHPGYMLPTDEKTRGAAAVDHCAPK